MNNIIDFLYLPLTSSLFAIVWVYALTEPGAIFGWWPNLSNKISTANWWIKLSYGCAKCLSGQICLWRILIDKNISIYNEFSPLLIWQILIAIFFTLIFEKFIES